ncbi:L-lactate dehydrogenase (cytochrome) [Cladophialophora yegresii CBS 114405]|uniref:L-lactate dehydrogenase (cytochrome) n=1 Tax=Cladophialophora yegresii CBS 114405 TaxID=1182544 RepID=W9W4U7_9EURO|nr:L-lactate dehydrogenase (cytochrome) [Cladophialophora yegresii CBS 114405]EXJ62973.1 L-lactate dehydrogenase (cytochrome) [Cladophialophora yegresii CBS 114405]
MAPRQISVADISSHNKDTDCWIVVDGQVWDITKFAPEHPGGPGIIYKYAGRDATQAYNETHSPAIIKNNLPVDALKGTLDRSTITAEWSTPSAQQEPRESKAASSSSPKKPPLDSLINAHDFELAARNTATAKTWAFYSSAANDLITRDLNARLFNKVLFRPRVMRRVDKITTATSILGHPVSFPLMIAPAAMARLIHPDGELALARAAHSRNILQCISNNASYSASEIVSQPEVADHPFWFQLYVNRDRSKSEALLRKIHTHPNIRGIVVTTDAAAAGKREADERVKADESIRNPMMTSSAKNDKKGGGYGRLMASFIDPDLNWDDVAWLRSQTKLPLLLKGIMAADDVKLALDAGLEGVVLSNHGGRNLDTSPPALLVLLELHARFPEIFTRHHPASPAVKAGRARPFSILVDGGVRRGTDILKLVCLGAVAAGIGRPALFATGYGQTGVEALVDILRDEFEVAMRNVGITSVRRVSARVCQLGGDR